MFFFFNDTATTEIYTLSLHDALPIYVEAAKDRVEFAKLTPLYASERLRLETGHDNMIGRVIDIAAPIGDRKSTRLNSSHANISYAVFCLKKKITIVW